MVKERIKKLLEQLKEGIYEKDKVMALALLSSIAGESIFLLGPPGVAKSLIARRLKYAFKDGKSFEYLMSRFSTPDEIFGPVAISKLKNEDKYERVVENYLPSADVVFLDEIWKAGPSIQNSLLTVINEKVYRNGAQEIPVSMKALISASNELPAKKEGLEALWDRFLIRLIVEGIQNKENFDKMISEKQDLYNDTVSENIKIKNNEFYEWSKAIDAIEKPENIFNVIDVIRKKLQLHNDNENNKDNQIYISDRRWRKILRLLRTSAFLNDRNAVDLMDCFLIKDCLWNEDTQIETVKQIVNDAIEQYGYKLQFDFKSLKDELDEFREEIKEITERVVPKEEELATISEYECYEMETYPSSNNNFIKKSDYEKLTSEKQDIQLRYQKGYYSNDTYEIKEGIDKFHIFVNDTEYKIKTVVKSKELHITTKPDALRVENWDKKVKQYSDFTAQLKGKLEQYKNNDLKHLRINIFVNPDLAKIVETNLNKTEEEIGKYEIEIRDIQNDYIKIENKEIIIE